jgi:GrpB-like predicted nucleotidyltransferase (UPF0157 family)
MLIEEYKERWIEDFAKLKKVISEALINLKVSIEHVGSTSIPGLAAKPIIDIDIVYDKNAGLEEIKLRLEKIGYFHNGNQGITGREVFKRSTNRHEVLDYIAHHLYVCPADSEELQKHILFRDYLLANPEARVMYQTMKYKIAEEAGGDRKKYAQLKESKLRHFITGIIEKAKSDLNTGAGPLFL